MCHMLFLLHCNPSLMGMELNPDARRLEQVPLSQMDPDGFEPTEALKDRY